MAGCGAWTSSVSFDMESVANAIYALALGQVIRRNEWLTPAIQTIHILAIGAVLGSALIVNLRTLGVLASQTTLRRVSSRYLPWICSGLAVLLVSGLLLVIGEPQRELLNPLFWWKMGLVVAVFAGVLLAHQLSGKYERASGDSSSPLTLRILSVLEILALLAIVTLGRWIGYYQ